MIAIMSSILSDLSAALPAASRVPRRVAPGATLFRQGERPLSLYLLREGRVDLMRWTADGTAVRLHSARPGETVAEASLFSDSYHCDAIARSASLVVAFELEAVRRACEGDPALAFALMRHLALSLRDARRIIELRSVTPLTRRLRARLSDLADAGGALPAGLRMKDVAAEIGATPEATYRALAALVAAGDLERRGRGRFRLPTRAGGQG